VEAITTTETRSRLWHPLMTPLSIPPSPSGGAFSKFNSSMNTDNTGGWRHGHHATNSMPTISTKLPPPEFVAIVLASSVGMRLFPLTNSPRSPKHLLPVAVVPILHRLLQVIESVGFLECIVAIQHKDDVMVPSLQALFSLLSPTPPV